MRVVWPIHKLGKEYSQYPGVMSISSLLRQHGFHSVVVAAEFDAVQTLLQDGRPSILAYSTPTGYFRHYVTLNRQLKAAFPSIVSVFGGPHPTFFPEMIEEDGVDGICIGEGEYAMLDLVRNLSAGEPVRHLENWWIKEGGGVHKNAVRPLIKDLDVLPQPDHALFAQAIDGPISQAIVMTSRGCPHHCTYCYNHIYRRLYEGKGKVVRRRSVDHVMVELREIKRTGYEFIRFMDDLFILSREWVEEFATKYREQGIGLPFTCLVRANYVTGEVARALKAAGCYRMLLGVEAGNEEVRNGILKRNMTTEDIRRAAEVIKDAGLRLVTANIIGIPGGSLEADLETLALNIACKPDYASVALLHPFPRTEIGDYARELGLLDDVQMAELESSTGFGLRSPLRFKNDRERRGVENLQKFFCLAVWLPWLLPLVQRLIRLPQNRLYDMIYTISVTFGMHFKAVPLRAGILILWHRTRLAGWLRRRPVRADSPAPGARRGRSGSDDGIARGGA